MCTKERIVANRRPGETNRKLNQPIMYGVASASAVRVSTCRMLMSRYAMKERIATAESGSRSATTLLRTWPL